MTLDPIQNTVNALITDDKYLYVGMGSFQVVVLDKNTFVEIVRLKEQLWEVKDIAINDKFVFISTLNQKITVFSKNNWKLITILEHRLGVLFLYEDNDRLYSTSYDGRVLIWQVDSDKADFNIIGHLGNHMIKSNCVILINNQIITGEGFKTPEAAIKIWDSKSFELTKKISDPQSKRITCFTNTEKYLFSGHGGPGECRVWNLADYTLIKQFQGPSEVKKLIIQHNQVSDNLLIIFSKVIYIVNLINLEIIREINLPIYEIKTAVLDPVNDNTLIMGTRDKLIFINYENGSIQREIIIQQQE